MKYRWALALIIIALGVAITLSLMSRDKKLAPTLPVGTPTTSVGGTDVVVPSPNTPAPKPSPTSPSPAPADPILAASRVFSLAVPFVSQSPHQNWDLPYQEFCEEASALMAALFVNGQKAGSTDEQDAALLAIKEYEMEAFGYYKDTSAQETAQILTDYFGLMGTRLIRNPSYQDIRDVVEAGHPVIVPAAGRELVNPYFRNGGPPYHMVVVRGFTKSGDFITNDPGTRRGEGFVYTRDNLMSAMHDWNGGDVSGGEKVVIVVEK